MDDIIISETEGLSSGEETTLTATAGETLDYPSLMRTGMKFSFTLCGSALIISLGVAVIIKILRIRR